MKDMTASCFLNLAGPPRSVPLLVRVKVFLGGFFTQSGFFLVGFGMVFVWAFTMSADLTGWYRFRTPLGTAEGTILHSKKTNISVGGDEHRKGTPICANHYSFLGPDGAAYEGVSFVAGRLLQTGQRVTVEYPQGRPQVSRIRGMRSKPLGPLGVIPVIIPVLGIWAILCGFKKGLRGNRLLAMGARAKGRLKSKVATNTRINKRTVYKLTFEFTTPDGQVHEAVGKTHLPEKLEDEAEEPLLYDPLRPSYAVMLDALPGSPRIDEQGHIRAGSAVSALQCLVVPTAAVVGHAVYIYATFLAN